MEKKEITPGKELVILQGEYAILKREDFHKLYIPGIESKGHTLLVIKALDAFKDKRSASYFLAGHFKHHKLQMAKEKEKIEEIKFNMTVIVKDFIKTSKAENLHFVVYNGHTNGTSSLNITNYIKSLEKKLIKKDGLKNLSMNQLAQEAEKKTISFMVKSNGSIGRQTRNSDIKKPSADGTSMFTKTIERTWIEKRAAFLVSVSDILAKNKENKEN
ncbi:hypothetical protein ACFL0U_03145 [Pseudomonadota bacterium]